MTFVVSTRLVSQQESQEASTKSCTLHVCTSCRPAGCPREPEHLRPGFLLYKELRERVAQRAWEHEVKVVPAQCLSVCRRPCGVALSCAGSWTYIFGDQDSSTGAEAIVDCVALYLEKKDGYMVRAERPSTLRASILGRVPPAM